MIANFRLTVSAFLLTLTAVGPVVAQTIPLQRTIDVSFTGTVTNSATETIQIRQPNGSFAPYTGPRPDYPYKVGDQVTVGFRTTVPTGAYFQSYGGQIAADGIYRFNIVGPNNSPGPFGVISGFDVSGPIREGNNAGQRLGSAGLTIVYDSRNDSYSVQLPNGSWTAGALDGPSFVYDRATGGLTPSANSCIGPDCSDGLFNLRGTNDTVTFSPIPIRDSVAPVSDGFFGGFTLSGLFNLPIFGSGGSTSGGDPTPVPEPGMMLLFAGGVGWLVRRQRGSPRKPAAARHHTMD